jgi:hypothetical protein
MLSPQSQTQVVQNQGPRTDQEDHILQSLIDNSESPDYESDHESYWEGYWENMAAEFVPTRSQSVGRNFVSNFLF